MSKLQISAIVAAAIMFLGLYFGFSTKPVKHQMVERSRAIQGESTSFETLLTNAKSKLPNEAKLELGKMEDALQNTGEGTARISMLKNLSGWWYRQGSPMVAGSFAEQVAEIEASDTAWSVSGATFFNALIAEQDPVLRDFCAQHAVKAFESAASLNPEKVEYRVNLALVYSENPPPDNPMQAVLMLRDLEQKYPENASVYNALGRLAIKTGQWQRAIDRLEKAWSLDKTNANTPCLLAKAYAGAGNQDKAAAFNKICTGG